jgi:hypothetical protein
VEHIFASLSKRQTMLLLTSLASGGKDAVEAYAHLAQEDEELLRYRAGLLLQVPREQRIPFIVQELKRLVTQRRKQLGNADPEQLAAALRHERPVMIEVVMRSLPADLAQATRMALSVTKPIELLREVRPEIQTIIRTRLEDVLRARTPPVGVFRFSDIMTLQQREVLAIGDRMGARVLATAIAGLADEAREAFFAALPPDQRQLAARAAEAGKVKRLTEDDARLVLDIHGGNESPTAGMRSAGAQRLVRAAVAQSPEFASRFVDRHQGGELGKALSRWLKDERHKPVKGDGGRMDIVEQMERLAQKGVIDRPIRLPPPARPSALHRPGTSALPQLGSSMHLPALPKQPGRGSMRQLPAIPSSAPTPPRAPPQRAAPPAVEPSLPGGRLMAPAMQTEESSARRKRESEATTSPRALPLKRVMREGQPLAARRQPVLSPITQPVPSKRPIDRLPGSKTNSGMRSPILKGKKVR